MAKFTGNTYGITDVWIARIDKETGVVTVIRRLKLPATITIVPYVENWRHMPIIWQRKR